MKIKVSVALFISLLSLLAIIGFQGCNKEDVLKPEEFAPPTNFRALSKDASVVLFWDASPSQGGSNFVGYRILTRHGTQLVDSTLTGKTATNYTVNNLTNGEIYNFSIRSVKDNSDVSTEVTLQWGPTRRFTPARIYEFDSHNPSGVQFSTGSTFAFSSTSPDNRGVIDLWIDGHGNTTPLLKSPHDQSYSTGWRTTQFVETSVSDMNVQVGVPPISSFRSTPGLTIVPNKIYFAKTADGNYARFQVSAVQGTAPDRYVDITIAYNSGTGAWAKQ